MTASALQKTEAAEARRMDEVVVRPDVDIMEREGAYVIVADVPGADQQHLELSIEDRVLALEARMAEPTGGTGELLHSEFGPVRYQRSFELSDDIDREKISASVKDGVLRLTLPKVAQRVPRKIAVQAG